MNIAGIVLLDHSKLKLTQVLKRKKQLWGNKFRKYSNIKVLILLCYQKCKYKILFNNESTSILKRARDRKEGDCVER